jgi:hypothetical protein
MAILRRRGQQEKAQAEQLEIDPKDLETVAEAVRDAAEGALGTRPAVKEGPAPILAGCGPDAFWLELATDDPGWSGGLIVRDADDDVLQHEARWLRAAPAMGFPAPALVADPSDVLIFRQPPGVNLTQRMLTDMPGIPKLVAGFGRLHARLHALSADGVPAGGPDPLTELDQRTSHPDVRTELTTELDWLRRHPVPCHSEFNPVHVYMDGDDASAGVPVNWTRARVADAEYDVAATVTAFWSVPIYLDNAVYRRAMKMARDPLVTAYLEAYNAAAPRPLDDATLRYWQAYHLTGLVSDAARRLHDDLRGPWDTARGVINPKSTMDDLRSRIRSMVAG